MAAHFPIEIGRAFPRTHRRQMRRLKGRDLVLVHGVVGDAGEPDLPIAPRLGRRPLDAMIEVESLPGRPHIQYARRLAGAA